MKTVRTRIREMVPKPISKQARSFVRWMDQMIGLPMTPWSPGAAVMFHFGRCGSTVVGDLLHQHPNIYWDGEVFYRKWAQFDFRLDPFDSSTFIKRQRRIAGKRYYGYEMKIHPEQEFALVHQSLEKHVEDTLTLGFDKFIILERRNYIRRMLSQIIGGMNKVRHIDVKQKPKLTRFHLELENMSFGVVKNPRPLIRCFEEIDRSYRDLEKMLKDHDVLSINYEEHILPDPRIAYKKICEYLGIEPQDVEVRLKRTNPFPISEMVENYDELEAMLKGTDYAWMLED